MAEGLHWCCTDAADPTSRPTSTRPTGPPTARSTWGRDRPPRASCLRRACCLRRHSRDLPADRSPADRNPRGGRGPQRRRRGGPDTPLPSRRRGPAGPPASALPDLRPHPREAQGHRRKRARRTRAGEPGLVPPTWRVNNGRKIKRRRLRPPTNATRGRRGYHRVSQGKGGGVRRTRASHLHQRAARRPEGCGVGFERTGATPLEPPT